MSNSDVNVKKYLKHIKAFMPAYGREEKRFFDNMKTTVFSYADDNPGCTYKDICSHFGEPKDVIDSYLADMDIEILTKRLCRTKLVRSLLFVCIILLFAGVALKSTSYIKDYQESRENDIQKEVTVVEETDGNE